MINPQLPHNRISPLINLIPVPPILKLPPKTPQQETKATIEIRLLIISLKQLMAPQSNIFLQPFLHHLLLTHKPGVRRQIQR